MPGRAIFILNVQKYTGHFHVMTSYLFEYDPAHPVRIVCKTAAAAVARAIIVQSAHDTAASSRSVATTIVL